MDTTFYNNRKAPKLDAEPHPHLKSRIDDMIEEKGETGVIEMAMTNPTDLEGISFNIPKEDGNTIKAKVVEAIEDHEYQVSKHPVHLRFCCSLNDDEYEEILTYQEVMDHMERDSDNPIVWNFKRIVSHQGPLDPSNPSYLGSSYNVTIEWENGETTEEPLSVIAVVANSSHNVMIGRSVTGILHKRHTALSFHRVREAIASGFIQFVFIPGTNNPTDFLSKH